MAINKTKTNPLVNNDKIRHCAKILEFHGPCACPLCRWIMANLNDLTDRRKAELAKVITFQKILRPMITYKDDMYEDPINDPYGDLST